MLVQHCPCIEQLRLTKFGRSHDLLHDLLHDLQKLGSLKYLWMDLCLLADLADKVNLLCRPSNKVPITLEELHFISIDYVGLYRRLLQYKDFGNSGLKHDVVGLASASNTSYVTWATDGSETMPRDNSPLTLCDMNGKTQGLKG